MKIVLEQGQGPGVGTHLYTGNGMDHVMLAELTEEEKVVEKKLRRRIDALIMPLAILVYLMN
jgi:hypothetical protein